jgi:hypothetical protein
MLALEGPGHGAASGSTYLSEYNIFAPSTPYHRSLPSATACTAPAQSASRSIPQATQSR